MRKRSLLLVAPCVVVAAVLLLEVMVMHERDRVLTSAESGDVERAGLADRAHGTGVGGLSSETLGAENGDSSPEVLGVSEGEFLSPSSPPVDIPGDWVFLGHGSRGMTSNWSYRASSSAEDAARALLPLLEAASMQLVESDFLDLEGRAWGCICKLPDDAGALTITMLPGGLTGEDGGLRVSIVMQEVSEWEEAFR